MDTNFEEIKQEINGRGLQLPCDVTSMSDLMEIFLEEYSDTSNGPDWNPMIPDVLSAEFIRRYRDDFASCGIYANEDAKDAVLVVCDQGKVIVSGDNCIVVAYGSAHVKADSVGTIIATDDVFVDAANCQVEAFGRAKVVGHGKTSIELRDEASAEGFDSTYIFAYSKGNVVLHDEAETE